MTAGTDLAYPPTWAVDFGEDRYGLYSAIEADGCVIRLRWIPAGRFQMGSDDSRFFQYGSEEPRHWVVLSAGFWLGETPVTQSQWQAVLGSNPSKFKSVDEADECPVERVNWEECDSFCTELNRRVPGLSAGLPTEAQWEYACRAGTETAYCGGDFGDPVAVMAELGWCHQNSEHGDERSTHPVGRKKPNPLGLWDMHGNVWEWCRDGQRDYTDALVTDPVDPTGGWRALRGGSWTNNAGSCRSAIRLEYDPGYRYSYIGFRLAAGLTLEASPEAERAKPLMKGAEQP